MAVQEAALFNQAAEDYDRKLKDPTMTGAIFFAVCRWEMAHVGLQESR